MIQAEVVHRSSPNSARAEVDLHASDLSYGWQATLRPESHVHPTLRSICGARNKGSQQILRRPERLACCSLGIPTTGRRHRGCSRMGMATSLQRIVYVLKNSDDPPRFYTGVTADLAARIEAHNAGRCSHTAKHRPWAVDVVVEFADETRALKFEKYLKSGSGCAFAKRRLR